MAQAGYTPISLYYSTTPAAVPLNTDLVAGELALNTNDEKLYFKNSAGTVKLLASTASTTNVASISFGSTGLTPSTATTGAVTVGGTLAIANGGTGSTSTTYCSLTSNVTGTLPIANGGTGQTTATAAFDALNPMTTVGDMIYEGAGPTAVRLPIGTTGQILSVSGGIPTWTAAPSTGLTVGTTPIASGSNGFILYNNAGVLGNLATTGSGSVVLATSPTLVTPILGTPTSGTLTNCTGYTTANLSGSINLTTQVTGTLPVANGGTGATTITANSVILGNGTSALNANLVAPGASGNVLTSNGTTWTSAAAGGGQLSAQLFTAPGTWTKPSSASQVRVTVIGGGGGGNLANGNGQPGNAGGTSSFGPAVSATGGNGGGSNANQPGSPGSGSVAVGTALSTAPIPNRGPGNPNSFLNLAPSIQGLYINDSNPGNVSTSYSTTLQYIAGSGGTSPSSRGGFGGFAVAVVPVSGPVSVTVGAGGTCPGNSQPNVNFAATGGAVLVEFVG